MEAHNFNKSKRPKVGISVLITSKDHPACVLIGKRKGTAPGEGLYAVPGGHLEFGESWEECARREVLEETGLALRNVRYYSVLNAIELKEDYHYIDIFMVAEVEAGEPRNLEPEKCEGWEWRDWEKFPPPDQMFCALRMFLEEGHIYPFSGGQQQACYNISKVPL